MVDKKSDKSSTNTSESPLPAADPAPLGLTGLAVATLVLGLVDLGLTPGAEKTLMIPWAIFLGATAQLVAGIIDYKRKNIFGGTAFTLYAMLWYSVALTLYIPIFTGVGYDMTHYAFGLLGFLIFSFILTIASLMTNKVLVIILIFIDLAIGTLILNILTGLSTVFVGTFLICLSASSFYGAAAVLINTMAGRTVLPLGTPIWAPAEPKS